ncbi:serine/threonine-protein phosphatase [Streptomyces kanamyceticus]|uniref:Serine/threonine-protein phosphatase n=2 Tax=Streptomyces kanamyceticus TaxID=1967 RepID=A0A5J6GLK2_STRKN|nr:PP2C family protein-serine/threonine phosphatase [Streptomyces kanamyceticus]QEU94845.1 serine/threonine-protein phosphatase [Streptomyces kanamyceticus]
MIRAAARRRDAEQRDWLLRGTPPPPWVRWPPPLLLLSIVLIQLVTPETVDLSFLVAAVPPLAALSYGPAATAVLGGVVVMLLALPGFGLGHPGNSDELTISFIALLSVLFAWVRSRREAQLVTVRTVAEAAQFAVLPPLPERVGGVGCAGLYEAAQHESLVGGDFFDVRRGPTGVRAVVGDVQGHGLAAVGTVAALLGAFREAVLDKPDLEGVAARLDRRLVVDSAGDEHAELFATAVLLEFPDDSSVVRVVSCGHPPPLLLRGSEVTEIAIPAGAPLGLGLAGLAPPEQLTVPLLAGDLVLALTDGVSEARDATGTFYPLPDRLTAMLKADPALLDAPQALTERVWSDVVGYAGSVRDDVTMMVFAPSAVGEGEGEGEGGAGAGGS